MQLTTWEGILNCLQQNNSIFADKYRPGFEAQVNEVDDPNHHNTHPIRTCKETPSGEFVYTGDKPLAYSLLGAAALIGISGWNVKKKLSYGAGFDFDHIANHPGTGTTNLETILEAVKQLDYVEIVRSKSATGYHLWVWFAKPVPIRTRPEQKALGRAILQKISYDIGYDLAADVDALGGNLWIWSRDAAPDGLTLIKEGTPLTDVPEWRPHLDVATRKRRRTWLHDNEDDFDYPRERLDADHRRIIDALHATGYAAIWNHDHNCVTTHTVALKQVHQQLGLRGIFETNSPGSDAKQNSFAFPAPNGAWRVYRFHKATEANTWEHGDKWTHCSYNTVPTFPELARVCKATILPSINMAGIIFPNVEQAQRGLKAYGTNVDFPSFASDRQITLKVKGKAILEFQKTEADDTFEAKQLGWSKGRGVWAMAFELGAEPSPPDYAAMARGRVRYLSEDGEGKQSFVMTDKGWESRPEGKVKDQLAYWGLRGAVQQDLLGWCSMHPYRAVSIPFGPEYPGSRQWNRDSAQLKYQPASRPGPTPIWDKVLSHLGKGLDDAVISDPRCAELGITTGQDYLEHWIANVIRHPHRRLPILAMYSPEQDTGKSTLHEGLDRILVSGVEQADKALMNDRGFNSELRGVPICVVEELNVAKYQHVYDRLKSWNTNLSLGYEGKGDNVVKFPNYMHWVLCVNKRHYIPIEDGDTRFVVWRIPRLGEEKIPDKDWLMAQLEKEAPHFLHRLFSLNLDTIADRHTLPVLMTMDKEEMMDTARLVDLPLEGRLLDLAQAVAELETPVTLEAKDLLPKVGNWDGQHGRKTDAARAKSLGISIKYIQPHMPDLFHTRIDIDGSGKSNRYTIMKA